MKIRTDREDGEACILDVMRRKYADRYPAGVIEEYVYKECAFALGVAITPPPQGPPAGSQVPTGCPVRRQAPSPPWCRITG